MMFSRQFRFAGALCLLWLLLVGFKPAHAQYTDPGSAALLIQIIGSTIFGLLFYFGVFRKWLAAKLSRGTKQTQAPTPDGQELPNESAAKPSNNSR